MCGDLATTSDKLCYCGPGDNTGLNLKTGNHYCCVPPSPDGTTQVSSYNMLMWPPLLDIKVTYFFLEVCKWKLGHVWSHCLQDWDPHQDVRGVQWEVFQRVPGGQGAGGQSALPVPEAQRRGEENTLRRGEEDVPRLLPL